MNDDQIDGESFDDIKGIGSSDGEVTAESLRAEIDQLQRKLVDAPKRIRTLEEKLIDLKAQLSDTSRRNERLSATLREAREHIAALREEVEKLNQVKPKSIGQAQRISGVNPSASQALLVYFKGRAKSVECVSERT